MDLGLGRARRELVAAGTADVSLDVLRMDVGLHRSKCSVGTSVPDLHHRGAGTPGDPAVLLVHGLPESSHMWRKILPPLAAAGYHAVAPDLAGFGDSEPDPPGT
jgi:hypothetical protein